MPQPNSFPKHKESSTHVAFSTALMQVHNASGLATTDKIYFFHLDDFKVGGVHILCDHLHSETGSILHLKH